MPPCGGSLVNAKERLDKEPRDKDTIQFDIMMLVMEMNNCIKKENKNKHLEKVQPKHII